MSLCQTSDASAPNDARSRVVGVDVGVRAGKHDHREFHRKHLHAIAFNHGVGEQLGSHFGHARLRRVRVGVTQFQIEELALADVGHVLVAERQQGIGDDAALRIEHGGLESDIDTRAHSYRLPSKTRPKIASTFRSCSFRSKAFSISAAGRTAVTSASASSRPLKSCFSWKARMALRCTHS